ncbi:MAG: DUF2750 domain-containing protein [Bradyrhizobium sp.]
MSQSASQAHALYRQVVITRKVWTIRDQLGFPAPMNGDGSRAQPFWSSLRRAQKSIATVPAFSQFETVEIALAAFLDRWLPGLEKDRILVGLNWTGERATGYDVDTEAVRAELNVHIGNGDADRK